MFCRFYHLKVGTGISILDYEKCVKEKCQYYNDELCEITQDVNIHLDNVKFGWEIDEKINLSEKTLVKSQSTYYYFDKMIKMIHPSQPDVWIFSCYKKDKTTKVYLLYIEGKDKGAFGFLTEVIEKMKKEVEYNGRDLKDGDFIIERKNSIKGDN